MTDDHAPELDSDLIQKLLGNVLMLSVNEGLVAAQLEAFSFFEPMPAKLDLTAGSDLDRNLLNLSVAMGGPPKLILAKDGENRPQFDTYAEAAISEVVKAFMLARSSVCRSHIYCIGSELIKRHPELMHLPEDPKVAQILIAQVGKYYWEHVETSYVRLASFWDRVGQLLDFVFFNIRQYERDGFAAVMDRIQANFLPLVESKVTSVSWSRLRKFQTSEQPDGLKWLVRRRNLLIHSLHLRPSAESAAENPIFTSAYNHLEATVRGKLAQGTAESELNILHGQLSKAVVLFPDAVEVALMYSPTVRAK